MTEGKFFDENIKKWQVICGWTFLCLYCFGLLKRIPVIKNISFILEIAFILFFIPVLISAFKRFRGNVKSLLWIPVGIVLIFILQTVLWNSIILPNLPIEAVSNANQNHLQSMLQKYPALYLAGIVAVGPVLEEILYRMVCFGSIYHKNHLAAHLATALLFGFQHVAEAVLWQGDFRQLINMIGYMIFSFILTFIYSRKKNIWLCIGIHISNNLSGVILLLGLNG